MKNQDLDIYILSLMSNITCFIKISFLAFLIIFIVRVILKNSTFEYFKILSAIIILTLTFFLSTDVYKIEQKSKLEDKKITIMTSNLSESEKSKFIDEFTSDQDTLEKIDVTYVYAIAELLILGLIAIVIRDTVSDVRNKLKSKIIKLFFRKQKNR